MRGETKLNKSTAQEMQGEAKPTTNAAQGMLEAELNPYTAQEMQ